VHTEQHLRGGHLTNTLWGSPAGFRAGPGRVNFAPPLQPHASCTPFGVESYTTTTQALLSAIEICLHRMDARCSVLLAVCMMNHRHGRNLELARQMNLGLKSNPK